MYLPKHHEETNIDILHGLIRARPLGTWVMYAGGELLVNHVPFLLDASGGEYGTLRCHVARANPVWQSLSASVDSVVVFHGPQAYVTPAWYPSKDEHGKAVPTWNYAVVHAHGIPRAVENPEWLLQHVNQLTNTHEAGNPAPWKVTDAPKDYIDRLLQMIVGIEIPINKLIGKWKVSQNRPEADKLGVAAGLEARGDLESKQTAELVRSAMATRAKP